MTLALIEMCPGMFTCFSYAPSACVCKLVFVHTFEHVHEHICAHAIYNFAHTICRSMRLSLSTNTFRKSDWLKGQ